MATPFDRCIVDIAKLRDYCLSDVHPRGRHKARVFRSRLGLTSADAALLREAILDAVRQQDRFRLTRTDQFGRRYVLDFQMSTAAGTVAVRSAWIAVAGEDVLQLTTCFVL